MIGRFASAFLGVGALVATNRRWTAPLSAMAAGWGLFIGIAIGPASESSVAGRGQVIEVLGQPPATAPVEEDSGGDGGSSEEAAEPPATAPVPVAPSAAPAPPAPSPVPPAEKEPPADEVTLVGTVVHVNPAAGSYSLAIKGGQLYAIHAKSLPAPGLRVRTAFRQLANGTYAERGKRERTGRADRAAVGGVVSFSDPLPGSGAYTVSVPGASVWVRPPAGSTEPPPLVGSFVTVGVRIDPPPEATPPETTAPADPVEPPPASCARAGDPPPADVRAALVAESVSVAGDPTTYGDFAGRVQAVCADRRELVISADDLREGAHDVTLSVPEGFDLSRLAIDDPVLATAEIGPTGALTLSGLAGDRGMRGADEATALQGDLAG